MILFSYDPKKNIQVMAGEFDNCTLVFTKKVNDKHFMVIEEGYGISEDIIQQLCKLECQKIRIISKNNQYEFDFFGLLKKPIKNYGHGNQRFLQVK